MFEPKDDHPSRVSFGRRRSFTCGVPFSPLFIVDSFSRRSFSYGKLPQRPLKLNVLKLDGSSFEIEVAKTASVAELKKSVEAAFSHLPKEGPAKVSWSHVWGHFCLCFDGQRLVSDSDYIADYEIRDGDQLLFARHLSGNYNLERTRSIEQAADLEQPRISDLPELGEEVNDGIHESCEGSKTSPQDNVDDKKAIIKHCEYSLGTIFRGWFPYRGLSLTRAKF